MYRMMHYEKAPKLVQRLRPLLIPIEDCPVVGGCCAAIVGFAKPNVANSDNSVSGVTGDCDSTFDAELKVLSRAQMPNTRVRLARCAGCSIFCSMRGLQYFLLGSAFDGTDFFLLCRLVS